MDIFGIFDCFIKGMTSNDASKTTAGPSRSTVGVVPKNNAVHRNLNFAIRERSKSSSAIYRKSREQPRSLPRAVSTTSVGLRRHPSKNLSQSESQSVVNDQALSKTTSKTRQKNCRSPETPIKNKESERDVDRLLAKSSTSDRNLSHSPSTAKERDRGPYCPAPKNEGNDRNTPRVLRSRENNRDVAHSASNIKETDRSSSRSAPKTRESDRNVVRSAPRTREGNECVPRSAPKTRESDRNLPRSASKTREGDRFASRSAPKTKKSDRNLPRSPSNIKESDRCFKRSDSKIRGSDRNVARSASRTRESDRNLPRPASKTREGDRCAPPRSTPKTMENDRNLPRSASKTREGDRCAPRSTPKIRESDRNVSQSSQLRESDRYITRSASKIRSSDRKFPQLSPKSKDSNKNIIQQGTDAKEREGNVCRAATAQTDNHRGVSRSASKCEKNQDVPAKSRSKQELSKQSIASKPSPACTTVSGTTRTQPSASCVGELTKQKSSALSLKSGGILSSRKLLSHLSLKRLSSYAFGKKVSTKNSVTSPLKSYSCLQLESTTKIQGKGRAKNTDSALSCSQLEGATQSSAHLTESEEASIKPSQECVSEMEQHSLSEEDQEKTAVAESRDITQQSAICLTKDSTSQQQDSTSCTEKLTPELECCCVPQSSTECSEKLTLEQERDGVPGGMAGSTYSEESLVGDPKEDNVCSSENLATDQAETDEKRRSELFTVDSKTRDSDIKHSTDKQGISNVPALTSECLPDQLPQTDDSRTCQSLSDTSVKPTESQFDVHATDQSGHKDDYCVPCISEPVARLPDKAAVECRDPTTASDSSSGRAQYQLYAVRESKEPLSDATEATLDALCSDTSQDSLRVANRGVSKPPPNDLTCYPEESVLTGDGAKQSPSESIHELDKGACNKPAVSSTKLARFAESSIDKNTVSTVCSKTDSKLSDDAVWTVLSQLPKVEGCGCDKRPQEISDKKDLSPYESQSHADALRTKECLEKSNKAQSKSPAANQNLSPASKTVAEPQSTKEKCKEKSEKAKSSSCKEESKPRKTHDSVILSEERLNKTNRSYPQPVKEQKPSLGDQQTHQPKSVIRPKESEGCLDKATFDSEQPGGLPTEEEKAARWVAISKLKLKEGTTPRSSPVPVIKSEECLTKTDKCLPQSDKQKSASEDQQPCNVFKSEIRFKDSRDVSEHVCKLMSRKANSSTGEKRTTSRSHPDPDVVSEEDINITVKCIPQWVKDQKPTPGMQHPCRITMPEIDSRAGSDLSGPIRKENSEKNNSSTGEGVSEPRCPPDPEVVSEVRFTKTVECIPQSARHKRSSSGEQLPCNITKSEINTKDGRAFSGPICKGMSDQASSSRGEGVRGSRCPPDPEVLSKERFTKTDNCNQQSTKDQKSFSGEQQACKITKSEIYTKDGRVSGGPICKEMSDQASSSTGEGGSRSRCSLDVNVVPEERITKIVKCIPESARHQTSFSGEQRPCNITKSEINSKVGRGAGVPICKGITDQDGLLTGEVGSRTRRKPDLEAVSEERIVETAKCIPQSARHQSSSSGEQRPSNITNSKIKFKEGRDPGGPLCKEMSEKANPSPGEERSRPRCPPDSEVASEERITNLVRCIPQSAKDQKSSSGEDQTCKHKSEISSKESKICSDKAHPGSDKPPSGNAGVSRSVRIAQSQSVESSSHSFSEQADGIPSCSEQEGTAARCVPISSLKLKKQSKEPTSSDLRDIQEDIRIWKDLYAGCLERLRSLQQMNQAPVRFSGRPEGAQESAPSFDKSLRRTSNNAQSCLDEMQGGMDEAVRVLESEYGHVESALRKHSAVLAELVSVLQNRVAAQTETDHAEMGIEPMKDVKDNIHYLKALITENETLTMQLAAERAKQQVLRQVQVTNDVVDESISATEDKLHRTNSLLKMQMKRLQYEISRLTEAQAIETKAGAILVEQAESDVENERAVLESLQESNERLHELLSSKRFVSGQRVFRRASRGSFLTEETMGTSYCALRREQLEYRIVISDRVQRNLELSNEEINYLENLGRRMYHEIAETTEEIRKSEFAWLQLRKERDELTKDLYPDVERLQMMQDVAKEKLDLESKLRKENMLFRHQLEEFQKDLLEVETELMSGVITRRTEATKNKVLELETLFENAKLHNAKLRDECDSKNLTISRHDSLASLSIDEEEFQRQISEKIQRMELRIQADMDRRLLRPKRYVFEAPGKSKVSFRGQRNVIRAPKNVAEWKRKREAPQGVSEPPQPQQPKDAQDLRREILAKLAEEKERAKEQLLRYEAHQMRQTADTSAEPNAQELNELLGRLGRFLNETRGQETTPRRIAPSQSLHGGEFGETLMHLIVQLDQLQSALTGEDSRRRTVRPTVTSERHRELLDKLPDASKRGSENGNPNRGSTTTSSNQINKSATSNNTKDNNNSQG